MKILDFLTARYVNSQKFHNTRTALFTLWAIYGIVPTVHWALIQGDGPLVSIIVPRYLLKSKAFSPMFGENEKKYNGVKAEV